MAGPTAHSLVSAVPGTVTIVDSACVWSVQLPRGTGSGFGFARLVVPGTLCFADFAGVIAAGGVVSRLSSGSAAAAAINLGLDSVAPVTLTVERQIQRLGFATAARLAEAACAGIVLGAVVVTPVVLTVERLAPRSSVVAINHPLGLMTASAPAAVERCALTVGEVATESLPAMLVAPARSQLAYSAVLKVTQVALKPAMVQAAVLGMAAVAPRALFVEHPAFVAAMGLVNPFVIKMPLTFKSVVDSAPVVPVLFGPAKPSVVLLNSSVIECTAPRTVPTTSKPPTHITVNNNGALTVREQTKPLMAKPASARVASKATASTAKPWTRGALANKSGSAVQPRTTLSLHTRPLVESAVSSANPPPAKPRDRIAVTDKSEAPVLRKAKPGLPVRPAAKPAVAKTTALISKRSAHVVAINRNVSVQRLDEREVVGAVMKPINLLAGQGSTSTLRTASSSESTSAPVLKIAGNASFTRPRRLIPEARYVSSAETLVDNSDAISIMSTDDWDVVSHEDAAAFKPLRGPKRVWNRTKEKAAGLRRAASTISTRRHKSMNAELAK
ncbi:hypothetical protein H4R99_005930 [Coemansia sp. RSA 1722]|nr:hypothetical protein H4R99_005930 [Coemansia sp. RSA 1722]